MSSTSPSLLRAALIGGCLFGVAGGVPFFNLLNCACCSLVIAGGFLAAYFYSRECERAGVEFRPGNGALVGLVAGAFYALTQSIVDGMFRLVFPQPDPDEIIEMMERFGVPMGEVDIEQMEQVAQTIGGPAGIIFWFFIWLFLAAIFSTIGGLIGGAVFRVEPPQAPVPPTGSPPSPPLSGGGPGGGSFPPPPAGGGPGVTGGGG